MLEKFNLITTLYNNISKKRLSETKFCIEKNRQNILFNEYIIFLEIDLQNKELYNTFIDKTNIKNYKNIVSMYILNIINKYNVKVYLIQYRPTYKNMVDFCNKYSNKIWFICNSDIYFPKWNSLLLSKIRFVNFKKHLLVLTRYNIYDELSDNDKIRITGKSLVYNNVKYKLFWDKGCSSDTWIIKTPFNYKNINLNIEIGRPECDNMVNYQFSKIRNVINPCLSLISIHKHSNWSENNYDLISFKNISFGGFKLNKITLTRRQYLIFMKQNKLYEKFIMPCEFIIKK